MENRQGGFEILHEPLTQRERNILAHLVQDHSSAEIARLETLAASSVKWYIHQVYAKLGVNTRADAILRARALGLLPPEPGAGVGEPAPQHNLPRRLTSFIGRKTEIATLCVLVQQLPLVTLTGSGGTGKTSLALQVAECSLPNFADGVWLVSLAPLTDPVWVPLVAAAALGLREIPREGLAPALGRFIGGKHLLLVLDNCEHLVGAAAELAGALLAACPRLHILATSREVLGLPGERAFRCPPLAVPDPHSRPNLSELAQSEAVSLFVARAENVAPDFRLLEANAGLVAQVCQRLDGIPLAIELAAARAHLLSMEQIAARLENVFHLLTGGGRAALPRHQTLKALVDWSYDLLSEPERLLLCRLSVFAGSWALAAAETICAEATTLPASEILHLLGQLVDKSLVEVSAGTGAEPRYRMLEMIRQYAHQRLLERGGLAALREQHLDYYLALSLQAEPHLRRHARRVWCDRLEAELDNIRLSLEWALAGSRLSIAKGQRLAGALQWFWHGSLHRVEGVGWLNRLLAAESAAPDAPLTDLPSLTLAKIARGKALQASSYLGRLIGQSGHRLGAEAVEIFASLGEAHLTDLAYSYYLSGQKPPQECLELFRKTGAVFYIGEMLLFLTQAARRRGQLAQARTCVEECLQIRRQQGDVAGQNAGLWELGMLEFLAGDLQQAAAAFRASQVCCEVGGSVEIAPFPNHFYAWMALAQGDAAQAAQYCQTLWNAGRYHFIPWIMTDALGLFGWVALTRGEVDLAVEYGEKALGLIERPDPGLLAMGYYVLARVALVRGELGRVQSYLRNYLTQNYHSWPPVQLGFQLSAMWVMQHMAGQPAQAAVRAATLLGAQAAMADCLLRVIPAAEREAYHQVVAAARAALNPADFAAAWAAGQALSFDQAVAYALEEV